MLVWEASLQTDNPGSTEVCSSDVDWDRSVSLQNISHSVNICWTSIKTLPGSLAEFPAFENLLPLCWLNMGLTNKIFVPPKYLQESETFGGIYDCPFVLLFRSYEY